MKTNLNFKFVGEAWENKNICNIEFTCHLFINKHNIKITHYTRYKMTKAARFALYLINIVLNANLTTILWICPAYA